MDNLSEVWTTNCSQTAEIPHERQCSTFIFVVYIIFLSLICAFGVFGNGLAFFVLRSESTSHVATFLLEVMAVADNAFLMTTCLTQVYAAFTVVLHETFNDILMPYLSAYVWPFVHMTQMYTVWITVLIALNRYIAICKPFQAANLCTMSKVRMQVAGLTLFVILYNIPRFLEHLLESNPSTDGCTATPPTTGSNIYTMVYSTILYCFFVFLGPLLILTYLNICLIRELKKARKRLRERQLPNFKDSEDTENSLTLVMIVIVLIFIVCQTPAFINQVLNAVLKDKPTGYRCGNPYFYFFHVSNLLVVVNSSVNFIVYCIFRRQFRQNLYRSCRFRHESISDTYSYNTDEMRNNCPEYTALKTNTITCL